MKNEQSSGSFWKGKGFYAALTLVITGAVAAGFFAVGNMLDTLDTEPQTPQYRRPIQNEEEIPWQHEPHTPAEEKKEDVPFAHSESSAQSESQNASSSQPKQQDASSTPAKQSAASETPEKSAERHPAEPPSFALPTDGASLQGFTGDELVYDRTMNDWRTHNGMDLAGEKGTPVAAPASAAVADVKMDPQWGNIVELRQGDILMRVCGLAQVNVKAGDEVKAGEPIGVLGEIPAESALEHHVHVEVIREGRYLDPEEFFGQAQ